MKPESASVIVSFQSCVLSEVYRAAAKHTWYNLCFGGLLLCISSTSAPDVICSSKFSYDNCTCNRLSPYPPFHARTTCSRIIITFCKYRLSTSELNPICLSSVDPDLGTSFTCTERAADGSRCGGEFLNTWVWLAIKVDHTAQHGPENRWSKTTTLPCPGIIFRFVCAWYTAQCNDITHGHRLRPNLFFEPTHLRRCLITRRVPARG